MSGPIFSFNGLLGAATDFCWLVGRQIATKPPNRQQAAKSPTSRRLYGLRDPNIKLKKFDWSKIFLIGLFCPLNMVLAKFWKIGYPDKILGFEISRKNLKNFKNLKKFYFMIFSNLNIFNKYLIID